MTTNWQLKCWNSMQSHNNPVLHDLYNMSVGLVIYPKARAFKAKAREFQGQGQGLTSLQTNRRR